MSEVRDGGSEVREGEHTESEARRAETGGEASEKTKESARREASESGGFRDEDESLEGSDEESEESDEEPEEEKDEDRIGFDESDSGERPEPPPENENNDKPENNENNENNEKPEKSEARREDIEEDAEIDDFEDPEVDEGVPEVYEEKCADAFSNGEKGDRDIENSEKGSFDHEKAEDENLRQKYRNCPKENGHWEGERGESKWIPDEDYVPKEKSPNKEKPYSNPDNLSMGEIMKKYGLDGIEYKDGEPNFDKVSKASVHIDNFSEKRSDNFPAADKMLAEKYGVKAKDVREWRRENHYVWHEARDGTMQLVPHEVHANVPHSGGISQLKMQQRNRR